MTAQIGDKFYYKGNRYEFVAINNKISFHPREYGLIPFGCCTCCWRGHWCEYEILPEGLFLQNLCICTHDDCYPDVDGVKVFAEKVYMGCSVYPNLNRKLEYSGNIFVGSGFLREYYIHAGYQRAWAYTTILEFEFDAGKLICVRDHSSTAQAIRENYQKTHDIAWMTWNQGVLIETYEKSKEE